MMTKQDFIALADWINAEGGWSLGYDYVISLAGFCKQQNQRFNRDRWLGYLRGECGPNGGKIPGARVTTAGTGKRGKAKK